MYPIKPKANKTDEDAQALAELMKTLESINTNSPLVELNATSISDNKGGRIEL